MDKQTRKSFGAKLTACGFIAVVLFGNFWLVAHLLGNQPALIVALGFWLGILAAFTGGLLTFSQGISKRLKEA